MTIESDVHAAIAAVCPRVFPVLAPVRTQRPYVTVQNVGGVPTYWMDRTPADKRLLRLFVKCWANSKAEALALARQVEVAMMAAHPTFTARVESELMDDVETDVEPWLYSELQEFTVIGPR
jgi:hypothetical protein